MAICRSLSLMAVQGKRWMGYICFLAISKGDCTWRVVAARCSLQQCKFPCQKGTSNIKWPVVKPSCWVEGLISWTTAAPWLPSSPNLWFANRCNRQSIRLFWIIVKSELLKSSISSICCNYLMAHTKPYLHKQHWQQTLKMRNVICSKLITQHPHQCSDIPFLGSFVGQKTHQVQIGIYQRHGGACFDGGPLWSLWGCHNLPPSV
jgi:hypothetical protein